MKFVICTFAPASRNEHRTYFVRLNKYAVVRETACFFYVLDEMGYERRVSKKTGNETGYKAGHAAEFSEIMEQAEAVDTVEAAAARRQYAAFTAEEKAEAEAINAAPVVTGETVRVGQVIEDAKGSRFVVTQVMRMAGYTDACGHVEGTYFPVTHGFRSIRFNTCGAASIAYGVKATRLIKDVEPEPTTPAADIKAAVEADHAEALELDAEHDAAAELVSEAIRIANQGGHWITGAQVAAMLTDGKEYTAAQLARAVVNQAKEAEQLEQYAAALTTAQQEHNAAQLASMTALDAACAASPDGLDDTPEFNAYEAAEAALTEKTTVLLQACGRYSVELARKLGRPVADVEALKTMFSPFYTGNAGSVHPGRVNELVSKALQLDVSAPQTR